MTPQEIFDKAATHLLTQNEKSFGGYCMGYDDNGNAEKRPRCLYRGPNGLQCAFGPFIPDDKYVLSMEGTNANGVINMLKDEGLAEHAHLFRKLQRIHDATEVSEWPKHLTTLAVAYALNADVVKSFERAKDLAEAL